MPKAPIFDATKRFLSFAQGRRSPSVTGDPGANGAGTEQPPAELTVAGRRYRLVPVDATESEQACPAAAELLTPRELQIVVLVADGNVNKQIADVLRISEWTVSTHLRRIFAKLGVDTRAAMVSRCVGAISGSRRQGA